MKTIRYKYTIRIILILILHFSYSNYLSAQEVLTNSDIIKLTKMELPSSAIVNKIRNSKTHFDVSIDALGQLKKQGVPPDVVSEMITSNASEQKVKEQLKDYSDPSVMRKEGIYFYDSTNNNSFITIDPTIVSKSKTGGFTTVLAQRFTYGIAKNNVTSSLTGEHSKRQLHTQKPVFYFYLNPATSISPNLFLLVRLTQKQNSREMIVASNNAYGKELGIDEKANIEFQYDEIASGVYRVYPSSALTIGEYCFVYTGTMPSIFSHNKVYDFGIRVN